MAGYIWLPDLYHFFIFPKIFFYCCFLSQYFIAFCIYLFNFIPLYWTIFLIRIISKWLLNWFRESGLFIITLHIFFYFLFSENVLIFIFQVSFLFTQFKFSLSLQILFVLFDNFQKYFYVFGKVFLNASLLSVLLNLKFKTYENNLIK